MKMFLSIKPVSLAYVTLEYHQFSERQNSVLIIILKYLKLYFKVPRIQFYAYNILKRNFSD